MKRWSEVKKPPLEDAFMTAFVYALEENWSDPIAFAAGAEWAVGWVHAIEEMATAIRAHHWKHERVMHDSASCPSGRGCQDCR